MSMAKRIKEERIKKGLTQEQLADQLGIQKSAIAKYENGRIENIKRSTIVRMAAIFGCDPCYLLDLVEKPQTNTLEQKINDLDAIDRIRLESYVDGLLEQEKYLRKDTGLSEGSGTA
ncbi:MAG: helix-turn-helix transcriptional regulator [Lachnospiraceae bacterium]|nr:helix-turn-helix transcriptional regulator [Lachnospiraceae bacterium]